MRSEWVTLGLVALGLLAAELGLRAFQDSLSGDVEHLNQADSIVAALDEGDGLRVLLAGNSLLFSGVDEGVLEADLEQALGTDVTVGQLNPDGTGPLQWSYLYRKLVFSPERLPDVMVIAFGPGHLRDRDPTRELLRLAAHHVDRSDIPLLFEEDLTRLESRIQFLLARGSTAFALRDRIAPRVFDKVIPRYRDLAPILLGAPANDAAVTGDGADARGGSFVFLNRLLDDASRSGVEVLGMPMPVPYDYTVETEAAEAFAGRGLRILPTNVGHGIAEGHFPDRLHLDEQGKEQFTDFMAPILAAALAEGAP